MHIYEGHGDSRIWHNLWTSLGGLAMFGVISYVELLLLNKTTGLKKVPKPSPAGTSSLDRQR